MAGHIIQADLHFIQNKLAGDPLQRVDAIISNQDGGRRQKEDAEEDRIMRVRDYAELIVPFYHYI